MRRLDVQVACACAGYLLLPPRNHHSPPAPASQARSSPMLSQLHRDRACAARQVKEPAWFHCSHTVVLRNEWRWLHGRPVLLMIRSRAVQAHAQPHKAADPQRTATRPMGACCAAARGCALAARRHQGGSATRRRVARASSRLARARTSVVVNQPSHNLEHSCAAPSTQQLRDALLQRLRERTMSLAHC